MTDELSVCFKWKIAISVHFAIQKKWKIATVVELNEFDG